MHKRDIRGTGSIPGSGRSPGGGHGNPVQYSCLENPMDRGAWQVMVHRVAQRQTQLMQLSTHTASCMHIFTIMNETLAFAFVDLIVRLRRLILIKQIVMIGI